MHQELSRRGFLGTAGIAAAGVSAASLGLAAGAGPASADEPVGPVGPVGPAAPGVPVGPIDPVGSDGLSDGETVFPSDGRYQTLSQGFNQRWSSTPSYIRVVGGEADAVTALRSALDKGLRPTIRGGGHCYEGFVDNDRGVILDLSTLRGVRTATDKYGAPTYSVEGAPPTGTSTPRCSASSVSRCRPVPATRSGPAGTSVAAGTGCSPGGTG